MLGRSLSQGQSSRFATFPIRPSRIGGEVGLYNRSRRRRYLRLPAPKQTILADRIWSKEIAHFAAEYLNPNGNFEEACAVLGVSTEMRQFAVDQANFATRPMLPGMYYPTQGEAQSVLDREGGHYRMLIMRGERWVQCPVHVGYVLQGSTKDRFVIRCKMSLPRLHTQLSRTGNHYQYDGLHIYARGRHILDFRKAS